MLSSKVFLRIKCTFCECDLYKMIFITKNVTNKSWKFTG